MAAASSAACLLVASSPFLATRPALAVAINFPDLIIWERHHAAGAEMFSAFWTASSWSVRVWEEDAAALAVVCSLPPIAGFDWGTSLTPPGRTGRQVGFLDHLCCLTQDLLQMLMWLEKHQLTQALVSLVRRLELHLLKLLLGVSSRGLPASILLDVCSPASTSNSCATFHSKVLSLSLSPLSLSKIQKKKGSISCCLAHNTPTTKTRNRPRTALLPQPFLRKNEMQDLKGREKNMPNLSGA